MTLSWNPSSDNIGVTGYRTYLNGNQVGTSASTSYGFGNLSCGATYTLGVAAVDAAGNVSGIATLAKQTAACSDTTAPSAPGTLTSSAPASTEIDLSWGAATDNLGVTGYQIWRWGGENTPPTASISPATGAATTYKGPGAQATTYSYQVRAVDAAGNTGPYTNTTQTTTPTAPPAMYSIGGTISGLSGTVVLQDNGGDDLSLSSNGAFTFATPLPTGATYNVTVKTNPDGQSCSVSGGTGTVASANVTNVAVTCTTSTTTSASDDFNRANGGLGAGWAAMSDGGLSIVSQPVVGTASAHAGDIRVAESYGSDQYSQIEVTSTQLTGGQWIGPAVRSQNGGQDTYLGIYFWNNGSPAAPALRAHRRHLVTQLGSQLQQRPAARRHPAHAERGRLDHLLPAKRHHRIAVTDTTLTGGAPGLMSLRRRDRRQLGRRHRKRPAAAEHVLDRRHRLGAVRHGGVAGQRRRRSQPQQQRRVHVRHAAPDRRRLQRHRQDQPRRPESAPSPAARARSPPRTSRNVAVTCTTSTTTCASMTSTGRMVGLVPAGQR